MVRWHSSEEAEAWWAELQELKQSNEELQNRLVDLSRTLYTGFMLVAVTMLPVEKLQYMSKRADHYAKLLVEAKDEAQVEKHFSEFVQEFRAYSTSG